MKFPCYLERKIRQFFRVSMAYIYSQGKFEIVQCSLSLIAFPLQRSMNRA